jgi:hypothetical protein
MVVHGEGVGAFTKADIERRAHEIALIDGRKTITAEDRQRARAELFNRDLPATVSEDADTMQSRSRDPSDPAVSRGHQVPDHNEPDEQQEIEKLAVEGVEEAQHEQMIEARRRRLT